MTFAGMGVAQASFFGPPDTSLLLPLMTGLYIYGPWFGVSVWLAWLVRDWSALTLERLIGLGALAAVVGCAHVALMTSAYWVFQPAVVADVTVGFVYVEQWLKWFHFEVLIFAGCVLAWRWRLRRVASANPACALVLSTDEGVTRLDAAELIWLEADDNYVIYHATHGPFRTRGTLATALKGLPKETFVQTHRSAVVNLNHVQSVSSSRVELSHLQRAPISRRRQREVLQRLEAVDV